MKLECNYIINELFLLLLNSSLHLNAVMWRKKNKIRKEQKRQKKKKMEKIFKDLKKSIE
jgi:hypothetical protein